MRDEPSVSWLAPLTDPLVVAEAEADDPRVPVAAVVALAVVVGARVVDTCGLAGVVSVEPGVSDEAVTPLGQRSLPMSDRGIRICESSKMRGAGQI